MKTILQLKQKSILFLLLIISNFSFGQCWNLIAGGNNHSLGLKSDGTLWAWGTNGDGQCGQGNFLGGTGAPTQIGLESNWSFIATGNKCSYAIKNDGTLWAWGLNDYGQLGIGTLIKKNLPIQIGTDNDWQNISSGVDGHVLAIKTNGTLWGWGQNNQGQLGLGNSSTSITVPTQVGSNNDWSSIATGFYYTLFLKTNGTLWSCGLGTNGELGNGTNVLAFVPTQIGTQNNWLKIASGMKFSAAINNENKLFTWGENSSGQLGIGNNINKNVPTQVNNDTNWDEIILGITHSVAKKNNNSVWTWGNHGNCQLGNGNPCEVGLDPVYMNLPQQINIDTDWDKIFTGYAHSFSIKSNGDLWAWGFNGGKQLGNNSTTSSNVPIAITCPATLGTNTFSDSEFSCYPNPTSKVINITNSNETITQINIYDIFGRLLKSHKGNANSEKISIQELPNAIYLVEINTDKVNKIVKIIKQ